MAPRFTRKHLRCRACGATYFSHQVDGVEYYHACAPLSDPEVITALGLPVDRSTWTPAQLQEFNAADRTRPNGRDENVKGGDGDDKGEPKAPGAGADVI